MQTIATLSAVILCLMMYVTACGLFKSDYKPYDYDPPAVDGSGTTTGDDGSGECPAGSQLTAFQANIASPVNATCSSASCHANISKMQLKANDDDENRKKLVAFKGTDAAALTGFLHGSEHAGGNMSSTLSAGAISTWLAAEAKCQ